MSEITFELKKLRLSKKNLEQFLNDYENSLYKPFTGTLEEGTALYRKEWEETNAKLKENGMKKNQRVGVKNAIKAKFNLKKNYKTQRTIARLTLIQSIRKTFLS